jgi:hypothetical protein
MGEEYRNDLENNSNQQKSEDDLGKSDLRFHVEQLV